MTFSPAKVILTKAILSTSKVNMKHAFNNFAKRTERIPIQTQFYRKKVNLESHLTVAF